MLWGQQITVYTDHKNLMQDALGLTSDRVYRWRLLLEEYGPPSCISKASTTRLQMPFCDWTTDSSKKWHDPRLLKGILTQNMPLKRTQEWSSSLCMQQRKYKFIRYWFLRNKYPTIRNNYPKGINNIVTDRNTYPTVRLLWTVGAVTGETSLATDQVCSQYLQKLIFIQKTWHTYEDQQLWSSFLIDYIFIT